MSINQIEPVSQLQKGDAFWSMVVALISAIYFFHFVDIHALSVAVKIMSCVVLFASGIACYYSFYKRIAYKFPVFYGVSLSFMVIRISILILFGF